MSDEQKVTVTCEGAELLSWSFKFGSGMKTGHRKEIADDPVGEDMADRRRDNNLRDMFGG